VLFVRTAAGPAAAQRPESPRDGERSRRPYKIDRAEARPRPKRRGPGGRRSRAPARMATYV